MITEQTTFRIQDGITFESLGQAEGSVVLSLTTGYLYTCNRTAACFLEAVDGQTPMGQIVQRLAPRFDVSAEQLADDLFKLADQLLAEGVLVSVP